MSRSLDAVVSGTIPGTRRADSHRLKDASFATEMFIQLHYNKTATLFTEYFVLSIPLFDDLPNAHKTLCQAVEISPSVKLQFDTYFAFVQLRTRISITQKCAMFSEIWYS